MCRCHPSRGNVEALRARLQTVREAIAGRAEKLVRPLACRRRRKREDRFVWALRDVSLEVDRDELVGIIRLNGAGKSTILKILSRVTRPTSGWERSAARSDPSSRSARASIPSSPAARTSI
jgi:ABC-type polysaccharide/polyol phosphate transport system ATPase subunit